MLVLGQPRSKLIRKMAALGPYLRENLCQEQQFFFDCLAVCANPRLPTEKREFWGWWLEVQANTEGQVFAYQYRFGFYDKDGDWLEKPLPDKATSDEVHTTLRTFYPRLRQLLHGLTIELQPAPGVCGIDLNTAA
ncbi:MAG: sigma factor-binding protein Crl [Plesiomonas sp.]